MTLTHHVKHRLAYPGYLFRLLILIVTELAFHKKEIGTVGLDNYFSTTERNLALLVQPTLSLSTLSPMWQQGGLQLQSDQG